MALNDAVLNARITLPEGSYYVPEPGDVIWTPAEAAVAWNVTPSTVVKYVLQGRVRHIKLRHNFVVILDREKPPPAAPGELTEEQREAKRGTKRR